MKNPPFSCAALLAYAQRAEVLRRAVMTKDERVRTVRFLGWAFYSFCVLTIATEAFQVALLMTLFPLFIACFEIGKGGGPPVGY